MLPGSVNLSDAAQKVLFTILEISLLFIFGVSLNWMENKTDKFALTYMFSHPVGSS